MSESSTLPLNVAETGPIFVLTTAANPFSPVFSNDWHPGIADLSVSGSLSSAQTFGLPAGKVTSPVIVMAMNVPFRGKPGRSRARSDQRRYTSSISHRARNIKTPLGSEDRNDEACSSKGIVILSNDLACVAKYSVGYYGGAATFRSFLTRQPAGKSCR